MYTVLQIKKVVVSENLLSQEEFLKSAKEAENRDEYLVDYLVTKGIAREDTLYQMLAQSENKPFINLKERTIRQDVLFLIPEPIAKTHEMIAFDITEDGVLKIAAVDPDDIQTFEFIEKKSGRKVDVALTTPESIRQALRLYHQSLETEFRNLSQTTEKTIGEPGADLEKLATDLPVVRLVNSILE